MAEFWLPPLEIVRAVDAWARHGITAQARPGGGGLLREAGDDRGGGQAWKNPLPSPPPLRRRGSPCPLLTNGDGQAARLGTSLHGRVVARRGRSMARAPAHPLPHISVFQPQEGRRHRAWGFQPQVNELSKSSKP